MSQRYRKKQEKTPMSRFERLQSRQKYGAEKQRYENNAPRVAAALFGLWSLGWLVCALLLPRAMGVIAVIWALGAATLSGAMAKVYVTKKKTAKYLSTAKPLAELYAMNSLDFEHAVAAKMVKQGYQNVRVMPSLGDGGIDIRMDRDGKEYAVQCKKYHPESYIKVDLLRAFVYAYRRAGCDAGLYVTTAKYSDYAREEMATEGVELIDGSGLVG